jgi:sugar lactone lactonase YvrE
MAPAISMSETGTPPSGTSTVTVYAPGSDKVLRTITEGVHFPDAMIFDGSGNLYVANDAENGFGGGVTVYALGGSSPILTISKGIENPDALALDGSGNLYVANPNLFTAGNGGTVTVYTAATGSLLRTIKKGVNYADGLVCDSSGNVYVANGLGHTVTVYAPGGKKPMLTIKKLNEPRQLAFGP